MKLIDTLFEGPLDVIGDIHGEIDGLRQLIHKLGYDTDGAHPDNRRLIFVGDLVDRGPDSPAVVDLVMRLVAAGNAQSVLGNHELNLLRGAPKKDNAWFMDPSSESAHPVKRASPAQRAKILAFLTTLPLALEREDLRIVHACWHADSIAKLRQHETEPSSVIDLYRQYDSALDAHWHEPAVTEQLRAESAPHGEKLADADWATPILLPTHAAFDADQQMSNPVRVVTSGMEAPTERPFWASGKWRMVERSKWWEDYDDATPVIVGHYWRRFHESQAMVGEKGGLDLFDGVAPHHWMGKRANVYCVDFSVGGRPAERVNAATPPFLCQLSALRVPEWEVIHDDRAEAWLIGAPGGNPQFHGSR
jgi:hypothetical protein